MKKNQRAFNNPDEYIALQLPETRAALEQIRAALKKGAPDAEEVISYQMPALRHHGMVAFYAACKKHYGLYIPAPLEPFKEELKSFEVSKATIKLPIDKAIPAKLITRLAKYAVDINIKKAELKAAPVKKKAVARTR